ncbi:MAG TPA: MFS transporter [Solirubrobacteraceae bacterium]|nr:MFS transporter [Solirubrobacteraceae bacterium]
MPRLSWRAAFWAIAFSFFVVTAFSTAPSSLYGLYERQEHLSSLTITFLYAVYAVGVVSSLLLAGHVSDWYGRRAVLLPAIAVAIAAAVVFLVWRTLAGLFVARILTGVAIGAAVATATAYITDLDAGSGSLPTRRAGITSTVANIGGLASGPLIAGLLARYEPDALTRPFAVFLCALAFGAIAVALSPEGRPPLHPRPRYRPQHLRLPPSARRRFVAACAGGFLCWTVAGLFAGLAGAFLAGPLHHPSPALCGLTIFLSFGAGILVQTTTITWPAHRLISAGIAPALIGLGLIVAAAWTSPPSLALFLAGGIVSGAGSGAIFRGSLTLVISTSDPGDRAGALATFFIAAYMGLSIPVLGLGIALQYVSPRMTLLIFALIVAGGIFATAPLLVRSPDTSSQL